MSNGLKKKVDGEFVDISGKNSVFRGAWSSDTLETQIDLSGGSIPTQLTPNKNSHGGDPVISTIGSVSEIGGTPPAGMSHVIVLPTIGFNKNSPENAFSRVTLDVSALGIKKVSRVSAMMGTGPAGSRSDSGKLQIRRNGSVVKEKTGHQSWQIFDTPADEDDLIEFRYTNTYGAASLGYNNRGAVTAIQIFVSKDPYLLGEFVTHEGKMWTSLVDNNITQPGAEGAAWTEALTLPRPSGTTAQRPTPQAAGTGFMYYDTELSLPVWSDGTLWKDAAGYQSPPP